jgi:hypothetical protein
LTLLVTGAVGSVQAFDSSDDGRPFPDAARVHFFNGTSDFGVVDFFLVPPGSDIDDVRPVPIAPSDIIVNFTFEPGAYNLIVRDASSDAVIEGPVAVTLEGGNVYGVLAVDAVGGTTADVVLFDDFN